LFNLLCKFSFIISGIFDIMLKVKINDQEEI